MRALIQRVSRASVEVDGRTVGEIGPGLCILVGVRQGDGEEEAVWLARKSAQLRIFEDAEGKLNLSLLDVSGAALVISQFTLYGDASKGRRPSFIEAARPEVAAPLVERFARELAELGVSVRSGVFGARMTVEIHNQGPVSLMLER